MRIFSAEGERQVRKVFAEDAVDVVDLFDGVNS